MSFIGDIIKWIVLYRLFTNPMLETAVLCGSVLLCLFFGAFVKFKNGVFSWLCYFILLGIPVTLLTIQIINVNLPMEDMQLSNIKAERYIDVNGDGIVFKRFVRRTTTEPLLGLQTITDPQRIDDFVTFVKTNYPDGIISYKTSRKYDGIMLVDSSGKDLNGALIMDGYVNVSDKTPTQYLVAANIARARGVGIWASTVGQSCDNLKLITFCISCFLLGYIFMQYYDSTNNPLRLKMEEFYEKIKNNRWP